MTDRRNQFDQPIGAPLDGWTARPLPSRAPMIGRYCRLEAIDVERHAADLFMADQDAPDDRWWTYLFATRPRDAAEFRAHVERMVATDDPMHFAIVDAATGRAVGTTAFMRMEPEHGCMEIGFVTYSPRLQQTAAGTEAMYLAMRRAMDELGYRRYEWKCDSLNAPSRAAALRYGFRFEGVFLNARVYKGRNRDSAWFSITDGEWPLVRAAFDAWLSPHNFDSAGRQRESLAALRAAMTLDADAS